MDSVVPQARARLLQRGSAALQHRPKGGAARDPLAGLVALGPGPEPLQRLLELHDDDDPAGVEQIREDLPRNAWTSTTGCSQLQLWNSSPNSAIVLMFFFFRGEVEKNPEKRKQYDKGKDRKTPYYSVGYL